MVLHELPDKTVQLRVRVMPSSPFNRIGKIITYYGHCYLKINIKSRAENNKANNELIHFLAKTLGISRISIEIETGHTCTYKILRIANQSKDDIRKNLGLTLF